MAQVARSQLPATSGIFSAVVETGCYTILVRGDSLRDLYAKALALLGLGVLAGVGALVDYWPARAPLPAIAGAPLAPAIPRSISPAAVARAPVQTRVVSRAVPPQSAARALQIAPVIERPSLLVAASAAGDPVRRESFDLEVTTEFADLVPAAALSDPDMDDAPVAEAFMATAEPSALSSADPTELFGEASAARIVLAEVTDEAGEGLITGAFKRTGTSIVKTGARTGASIFDAVRIVSGMVRRALPTN